MVGSHGVKISISSNGAYIARCFIDLYDDIDSLALSSGNICAGQTRTMDLPINTRWIKLLTFVSDIK